ncbi:type VII secretion protein EccB [Actinoplanes derwentensis]|uniref:Type VII secretion protein EccB n=1 Tax=Actinoplanes derwentensis TaxID=113562 RepID=A0A1H2C467_9ACTN|nr:type VII secretion protein EccB [Actinoplanes derwentensis]GID84151.1 type VII secretion protein EccB [Actinoplanes derwentensis]SDT65057.1 type VII secretion protein EccB [Actinoplanes derwentensis]
MTSRRDQLQSYQFMNQRVISAFVMRETDPAQSPLRRGIGALFGGVMVAILVAAGFGIYGVLTRTGADQWQQDGAVVVERETGAVFVYLNNRLNPALNFASAKLAAGRPDPQVFRIAAKSLTGTPRGVTIGIPGAPASLPDAGRQARLPWAMCGVPGNDPQSILLVGAAGPPGTPLGDRALLVTDRDVVHLIWQGRKHPVVDPDTTVQALFGAVQPTRMGVAWLNALPSGADIAPITVNGRGNGSDAARGFDNGDILVVQTGSGQQFHLILNDGRAAITALQQAVLNAAFPDQPRQISVNDLNDIPESRALPPADPATRGPDRVPALAPLGTGESTCAVTSDASKPPAITVGGSATAFTAAIPTTGTADGGRPLADAVQVPAGRFALVRVPGSGGFILVTDVALRHAVRDEDTVTRLGYPTSLAFEVPTALINSIPAGVTLDPAAALKPALSGTG